MDSLPRKNVTVQHLKDLIQDKVSNRWDQWAREHPHLAAAIDQATLVEATVQRLADDPAFQAAIKEADIDEETLRAAGRVLAEAEKWIIRLMPM